MGVTSQRRDGYSLCVTQWGIAIRDNDEGGKKEPEHFIGLFLAPEKGEGIFLSGTTAIRQWSAILRHVGKERAQLGLCVVCKKRPSGTAGRTYWTIVPDA